MAERTPGDAPAVEHDAAAERFVVREGEGEAVLTYARDGVRFYLLHTGVPDEMEGRGVGSALVRAALEEARREEARVIAFCPFAQAYLRRHSEYHDLLEPGEG